MRELKFLWVLSLLFVAGCSSESNDQEEVNVGEMGDSQAIQLFEKVPSGKSKVDFVNVIKESPRLNYYTYRHMYIGGGVATADFNNDGLMDIYFTANMSANKLYINKGDFQFEDVTKKAGVEGNTGFYMGVTVVDINDDGWMDIYLCKSGKYREQKYKENLLYINNGDLTFTESAKKYGLNDAHQSVQASFFDYDLDGDLDAYVVNTPVDFRVSQQAIQLDYIYKNPRFMQYKGNDHLYRNENGKFVEVSWKSGILADLAFGLNVSTADFNADGYPDIFVSNDFIAPDYLYINNGDGTFSEKGKKFLRHTSYYSMGSDPSDINNDGLADLIVLDMNPEDYQRSKKTMEMMDRDLFQKVSNAGYNNIYMHNMLHLNTGKGSFSEIGQISGIANTDWSWSSLVADFDNDGFKDLHITNGVYRDVLDRDLRRYWDEYTAQNKVSAEEIFEHLKSFPSNKLPNYVYKNENGYHFQKLTKEWGMEQPTFSNGSALADFDNDGDLDMVINNLMDTAFIYENKTELVNGNYLQVQLKGAPGNSHGIGAKVYLNYDGQTQFSEFYPTKGYLSATNNPLHFGLGPVRKVAQLKAVWPDGKVTVKKDVRANQKIVLDYKSAKKDQSPKKSKGLIVQNQQVLKKSFRHRENVFDDYNRQVLLPYKYSQLGPSLSVGDVNDDQLDDFYIGGAAGQAGALYIQQKDGTFETEALALFQEDAQYEDLGSVFLDYDGDGDMDLYVASGGYEFTDPAMYQDRLYENIGEGGFQKTNSLPAITAATASVSANDFDKDGDIDLFVGGRVVPGRYPEAPRSYVLINEGGKYKDLTDNFSETLSTIGMITSSEWLDVDTDGFADLIVTGEWMKPTLFLNKEGKSLELDDTYFKESTGWWQSMLAHDFSGDGRADFVFGNFGKNIKYSPKKGKPFEVYASDFDGNDSYDIVLTKYVGNEQVPLRGKECSTEQMPGLAKKFETFDDFAKADVRKIIGPALSKSRHLTASSFSSSVASSDLDINLPIEAQFSPLIAADYLDVNGDGLDDILLGGNIFQMEVETTRLDAGTGLVLLNKGGGQFETASSLQSGFYIPYDVKDIKVIRNTTSGDPLILVASNSDYLRVYEVSR